MASRTRAARQLWTTCLRGAAPSRSFCAAAGPVGSITVNNIPPWAPPYKEDAVENKFSLPYRDCTILTVLESKDMKGRADCRQGICRKCAVNVRVESDVYEVLSCQEIATDGLIVDLPDGWQPKPRWADPHPEKQRVTTRELKATDKLRSSASLGKKLKELVRKGNFAFKKGQWEQTSKIMDDIDDLIGTYGFESYIDFQKVSVLARDVVPDFLVAVSMSQKVHFFSHDIPLEITEKAGELAGHLKEHLEDAGTSAAAFDSDMDEMTIGSHGVGKKGAQTEGMDGGFGALESGAFYRNFSIWPELKVDAAEVEA